MAFAPNFDRYLKRGLDDELKGYAWVTGWSEKGQSWKVDVGGSPKKSSRPHILIEVELKKDNPVENVVKIWRWAREKKKNQRILFIGDSGRCRSVFRGMPITRSGMMAIMIPG